MEERIGFFICNCGISPSHKVDVKKVVQYAQNFEGILVSREYLYMCSEPGIGFMEKDIKEQQLTRVLVAACSPKMHEETFRAAIRRSGLNPHTDFHMVWVHENNGWNTSSANAVTTKAIATVRAGLTRIINNSPQGLSTHSVKPNTLIVGGGIAGMQAALDIAKSGSKVYLVEKLPTIGGHMLQYDKTFPTLDCAACIGTPKMVAVSQDPNIELMTYSEVEKVNGFIGNFNVQIRKRATKVNEKCTGCGDCAQFCPVSIESEWDVGTQLRKAIYIPFPQAVPVKYTIDTDSCIGCNICTKKCKAGAIDHEMSDEVVEVSVGSIIIATGFDPMDPTPLTHYGYGKYSNVFTNIEFERLSNATGPTGGKLLKRSSFTDKTKAKKQKPQLYTDPPKSVAILHCIGSRDVNHHEYCSRTCCMYALKYAHLLKDKCGEDTVIYNFYIDMRCFGKGYEEFYRKVQMEGVHMIRGKASSITENDLGLLTIRAEDAFSGSMVEIEVEMAILCTAMEPRPDSENVQNIFGLGVSSDGFFQESHLKMSPVSTAVPGIFLAGTCQGPKDIPDTVAQAKAAASECISLNSASYIERPAMIASINRENCTGCQSCLEQCPYEAIHYNKAKNICEIHLPSCRGCSSCSENCPTNCITMKNSEDEISFPKIEGILAN